MIETVHRIGGREYIERDYSDEIAEQMAEMEEEVRTRKEEREREEAEAEVAMEQWRREREGREDPVLKRRRLAREALEQRRVEREERGSIYIIQFSDRIKIGFSMAPEKRIKSLPHDRVLAVFTGGPLKEAEIHERFAHLRVYGEWFQADDALLTFAATIKQA